MNEEGEIVGMVDVLKLTYATLEQINTMSNTDSEGPAWNKFWLSLDHETESMVSAEGGTHHHHSAIGSRMMSPDVTRERITDSVAPGDSASHAGAESPPRSALGNSPAAVVEVPPADVPFAFKFKAPSGRVHRLQVIASHGIAAFVANVTSKMGNEVEAVGGPPTVEDGKVSHGGYGLSYLDDEGDSVSITTDNDLLEAILMARQHRRDKVDLFVHDPDKPPVAAAQQQPPLAVAVEPTPPPSVAPSSAVVRERRRAARAADEDESSGEGEDEDEDVVVEERSGTRRGRRMKAAPAQEQLLAGVPNDLLLPGAIMTLAVVIVGVFAI
jgi:hypothetical protein